LAFLSPYLKNRRTSVSVEYLRKPPNGPNIVTLFPSGRYPRVVIRWRDRSRAPQSETLTNPSAPIPARVPKLARPLVREAWDNLAGAPTMDFPEWKEDETGAMVQE
jgi:hypothetical protein